MSVPQLRTASRLGHQPPAGQRDSPTMAEERREEEEDTEAAVTVNLPRIEDNTSARQWNIPEEAANGTPGRALRARNRQVNLRAVARHISGGYFLYNLCLGFTICISAFKRRRGLLASHVWPAYCRRTDRDETGSREPEGAGGGGGGGGSQISSIEGGFYAPRGSHACKFLCPVNSNRARGARTKTKAAKARVRSLTLQRTPLQLRERRQEKRTGPRQLLPLV